LTVPAGQVKLAVLGVPQGTDSVPRPATGLDDVAAGEQLVEAGIAIGMDDAAKSFRWARGCSPLRSPA
jgi:hypothetical protein